MHSEFNIGATITKERPCFLPSTCMNWCVEFIRKKVAWCVIFFGKPVHDFPILTMACTNSTLTIRDEPMHRPADASGADTPFSRGIGKAARYRYLADTTWNDPIR